MIFNYRDDPTVAALAIAGVVLLTGGLLFMLVGPKPNTDGLAAQQRKDAFKIELATKVAEKDLNAANATIATKSFSDPAQRVVPLTVQTVTALAKKHQVELAQVRPQKLNEQGIPQQLPFLITVTGSYPAVISFGRELENPTYRLAMSSIQINSADANSDKVTGNFGVVAYLVPPPKVDEVKTTEERVTIHA